MVLRLVKIAKQLGDTSNVKIATKRFYKPNKIAIGLKYTEVTYT